jgi:hypothetical protein
MRVNTYLITLIILALSTNVLANKKENKSKRAKSEEVLRQEFELKKEFEVDARNRQISILKNAANCVNAAVDKTAIQNCLEEEKNDFRVLKTWRKDQKAMLHIK